MAARKSTAKTKTKTNAKKKAKAKAKKKSGAKKGPARKVAAKKAGAKKAGRKKAAASKAGGSGRPAHEKAASGKAAPRTAARKAAEKVAKTPPAEQAASPTRERPAVKSGVASADVSMGHVFALRPRPATSFRPDDFRRARQLLADESYPSIQDAARAVVEKALELTHEGPAHGGKNRRF